MLRFILVAGLAALAYSGKDGSWERGPPPATMTDCLAEMAERMEEMGAHEENYITTKGQCMEKCTPEAAKECLPTKEMFEDMKKQMDDMKKEFEEKAKATHECLTKARDEDKDKPRTERRCSEEPVFFGMGCVKDIMHSMLNSETNECFEDCMGPFGGKGKHGKGKMGKMRHGKGKGKGLPPPGGKGKGPPPPAELLEAVGRKKRGAGKGGPHMMCLDMFCQMSTMEECGEKSGLHALMRKAEMKMDLMFAKMEAMFPKHCECLKKFAESAGIKLPAFIKDTPCSDMPSAPVCKALDDGEDSEEDGESSSEEADMDSSEEGSMPGDKTGPPASAVAEAEAEIKVVKDARKRRSVSYILSQGIKQFNL